MFELAHIIFVKGFMQAKVIISLLLPSKYLFCPYAKDSISFFFGGEFYDFILP